jgi:alpha-beta hydrolase superfamily lysophospholipase
MLKYLTQLLSLSLFIGAITCPPSLAEVVCRHQLPNQQTASDSLYVWADDHLTSKAVILAIHGVTLHGGAYDGLARHLAPEGYTVIAPDLKGFGHDYKNEGSLKATVIYDRSTAELASLLKEIRRSYTGLPVICMGESMGGHLALRLAAAHPELVDGLILSGSSTKVHFPSIPLFVKDLTLWSFHPHRQVNLKPYIRYGISDDSRIVDERINDPLSRNNLGMYQLLKFGWMSRRTIDLVGNIPPTIPVLILQGNKDKLYKAKGVDKLMAALNATDKQVKWFPEAGHILLETKYLKPETISVINSWLDKYANSATGNLATETTVTGAIESPKAGK